MSAAIDLVTLGRDGARNFLQTVLVIDNELFLEEPQQPSTKSLATPRSGIRRLSAEEAAIVQPVDAAPSRASSYNNDPASPLNVKTLMDAFLRESLICGMHKPVEGNTLVDEAIKAARRSDAVIVDWLLEGSDATAAKEIISGILQGDRDEHGRLRLIVIYTSEPNVVGIVTDLKVRLKDFPLVDGEAGVLRARDTRIVVLNKQDTTGAKATVSIEQMPDRIVEEFAQLSAGVLSTFAVSAIAAVRRATHHVLAVFSSDLDGAFLAHRCALKTPEDATDFALEILTGELRSVVALSDDAMAVLGPAPLTEWIGNRARAGMVHGGPVSMPVAVAKGFATGGEGAVTGSKSEQVLTAAPGSKPAKGGVGQKAIIASNLGLLFHDNAAAAEDAQGRLARLASFKLEPHGRRVPPPDWAPTLSLGSLLLEIDFWSVPLRPVGYLLCTQPRCDAVRLKGPRRFSFQPGQEASGAPIHLIAALPPVNGKPVTASLRISVKPYEASMIEFAPTRLQKVVAIRKGADFVFESTSGALYLWLGDLRDLTAQRTASRVAARLHEVGVDEYEWLRRMS